MIGPDSDWSYPQDLNARGLSARVPPAPRQNLPEIDPVKFVDS